VRCVNDSSPATSATGGRREQGSLREMRKAFTRNLLIDSALDAFDARGFAAATIDDIASIAGVGRGTIYLHFGNKAEVLLAGIERTSDLWTFHEKLDSDTNRSELEDTFNQMYEFWTTVSERIWVHAREAAVVDRDVRDWLMRLIDEYAQSIQKFLERRRVSADDARARAFLLTNMWTEFIYRIKDGGSELSRQSTVGALTDFYEIAMRCTPPQEPE
jgi:AcrR family transcriptional regulator